MTRFRLAFLAAVTTVALVAAASAVGATALSGNVGPGFTITLTKGGKKVTSLKAGKYTLTVSDKSDIHNFHLRGPGVNKKTSVPATGKSTWTVTLKKGTYTFLCDPHPATMKATFKVA